MCELLCVDEFSGEISPPTLLFLSPFIDGSFSQFILSLIAQLFVIWLYDRVSGQPPSFPSSKLCLLFPVLLLWVIGGPQLSASVTIASLTSSSWSFFTSNDFSLLYQFTHTLYVIFLKKILLGVLSNIGKNHYYGGQLLP